MNIIFYHGRTIDPHGGGIMRVTQVLSDYFAKKYNVYFLLAKKTMDDNESTHYYLPTPGNILSNENRTFVNKLLEELRIDVFINQDGISPFSGCVVNLIENRNVTVFTVVHNSVIGLYGAFTKIPLPISVRCKIPICLLSTCNKITFLYFRMKYGKMWRMMIEKSDSIITLSPSLNKGLIDFTQCQKLKQKIVAIPNPVTLKVNKTDSPKKKQLLYVGRLSYEKNIILLLKIWKRLEAAHSDWSLLIVGDGPDRTKLENFVEKNKIKRIRFTGVRSPESYYNESSIFCMTSIFEGLPLVLLEAMAYGCVPIAFNSFETACDIIDDEINGKLICPYDLVKYAGELKNLIEDNDLRNKMSINAIEKSTFYNINVVGRYWIDLMKSFKNY